MDIIRYAIDRPVAVVAAVLMAVLFGVIALSRIPIQLAPDVRKPIVDIDRSARTRHRQGDVSANEQAQRLRDIHTCALDKDAADIPIIQKQGCPAPRTRRHFGERVPHAEDIDGTRNLPTSFLGKIVAA